jgi:hypothetical protein
VRLAAPTTKPRPMCALPGARELGTGDWLGSGVAGVCPPVPGAFCRAENIKRNHQPRTCIPKKTGVAALGALGAPAGPGPAWASSIHNQDKNKQRSSNRKQHPINCCTAWGADTDRQKTAPLEKKKAPASAPRAPRPAQREERPFAQHGRAWNKTRKKSKSAWWVGGLYKT